MIVCVKNFQQLILVSLILLICNTASIAQTNDAEDAPLVPTSKGVPPYEDRLHRVAELVGSLYYLTSLCQSENGNLLRQKMLQIIEAETNSEPARQKQLIAQYNKGYRAFASVYTKCTSTATQVATEYRKEGQKLIDDLLTRYTN